MDIVCIRNKDHYKHIPIVGPLKMYDKIMEGFLQIDREDLFQLQQENSNIKITSESINDGVIIHSQRSNSKQKLRSNSKNQLLSLILK